MDNPNTVDDALAALRPELHRYLARMMGSVIDGEDVLQDTLLKALRALQSGTEVQNLRAWAFRIAHTTALNALRVRARDRAMAATLAMEVHMDELPKGGDMVDTLRPFMALTPKQRSAVILRDVLGYSAEEVADLTESSVSSVKSALHRGRSDLRKATARPPAQLDPDTMARLQTYAAHFNAHDFDRIRAELAEEVRLDLVARETVQGKARVGHYFTNYSAQDDWLLAPGQVEDRPAILVFDRQNPGKAPRYFVLLDWTPLGLIKIRDFRYANYAMTDATWARV